MNIKTKLVNDRDGDVYSYPVVMEKDGAFIVACNDSQGHLLVPGGTMKGQLCDLVHVHGSHTGNMIRWAEAGWKCARGTLNIEIETGVR